MYYMGNCLTRNISKRKLNKIDVKDTSFFSFDKHKCYAKVVDVYDGDTCTLLFLWKNNPIKIRCRMKGYDSPEMKPLLSVPNREIVKEKAHAAKDALMKYIDYDNDSIVFAEFEKFDKYGRPLVTLFNSNSVNVNEIMVMNNHGYKYDGGTKNKI